MVEEVDVLFGVEGFEQRRGRVALVALAHLVDLVEHDHRVHHLDVLQGLHQLARLGADIGASVALDLRLVAHAADAEAEERPAEAFGDGLADTGLAHPGRADQQDNGAADFAFPGPNGKELRDPILDVVQPGVMLVEDFARMGEVKLVLAVNAPGQCGGPVQIVAGDGVFRRTGLEDRQLVHFLVDALFRLLRQGLAFQALLELLGRRYGRLWSGPAPAG